MSGVAEWLVVVTAYTVTTDTKQDLSRSVNPSPVGESQSWCLATTTKILRLQITQNREIFPRPITQSVGRLGEQPIQNHPRSGLRCQNITTGILSPCKPKSLASILLQEHSWCQAPLSGCYSNMAWGPPKELNRDLARICWQVMGDDPLCRFSTPSLFWASRWGAGCSETFCNREEEPTLSDGMLCLSESENKYSWESLFTFQTIPEVQRTVKWSLRGTIVECLSGSANAAVVLRLAAGVCVFCVCVGGGGGGNCSWQQGREWGQGWRRQSAVPNRPARGTRLQPHSQVLEKLR